MTGYCPTIVTSPRHVYQKLLPLLCRFCFVLDNNQLRLCLSNKESFKKGLTSDWSQFLWYIKVKAPIICSLWKSLYTSLRTSGWCKLKKKWMRILPRRDGGPKGAALLGVHLEVAIFLPSIYQIKVRPLLPDGWLTPTSPTSSLPSFFQGPLLSKARRGAHRHHTEFKIYFHGNRSTLQVIFNHPLMLYFPARSTWDWTYL